MKLDVKQSDIHQTGVIEKSEAKIASSPAAFMILSERLYSDKILAVIRELSTNARDAHIDAGNVDRPFDVRLPSRFKPEFCIRDYGIGLSKDDVLNLYNTYFASTKSNSNESTGAFGLGSKSPYAYSKSFSVRSFFNGEVHLFNAQIENSVPVFSYINTLPTTEENGLEIKVPVIKTEDFNKFYETAKDLYKWFSPAPNIVHDGDKFTFETFEKWSSKQEPTYNTKKTKNYYLVTRYNKNSSRTSYGYHTNFPITLVMGCVPYTVNLDQLNINHCNILRETVKELTIFADIGDVDVTPSRESLSYDAKTITYIERLLNKIINVDLLPIIESIVNSYETLWEVAKDAGKKTGIFSIVHSLKVNSIIPQDYDIKYKGVSVGSLYKDVSDYLFEVLYPEDKVSEFKAVKQYSRYSSTINLFTVSSKQSKEYRIFDCIVLDDSARGQSTKAAYYQQTITGHVLYFSPPKKTSNANATKNLYDGLIKLGFPKECIKYTSEIEIPNNQSSTWVVSDDKPENSLASGVWKLQKNPRHNYYNKNLICSSSWDSDTLNLDDNFYYIIVEDKNDLSGADLGWIISAKDYLDKSLDIWAVHKRSEKRVTNCKYAINLEEFVKKNALATVKKEIKEFSPLNTMLKLESFNNVTSVLWKKGQKYIHAAVSDWYVKMGTVDPAFAVFNKYFVDLITNTKIADATKYYNMLPLYQKIASESLATNVDLKIIESYNRIKSYALLTEFNLMPEDLFSYYNNENFDNSKIKLLTEIEFYVKSKAQANP